MKLPELTPMMNYDKAQIISEDDPHWFANCLTLPIAAELARRSNLFPRLVKALETEQLFRTASEEQRCLVCDKPALFRSAVFCSQDCRTAYVKAHPKGYRQMIDDVLADIRQNEQEGGEHGTD